MKVIINLDDSILGLVQQKADDDDRSRKQMLELIVKRAVSDEVIEKAIRKADND